MTEGTNHRILLKSRPAGLPSADNFEFVQAPPPAPGDGEMLIGSIYLSVDPAMKGWISSAKNYAEPVAIGEVMRSIGVGKILESNHPDHAPGEFVMDLLGWQEYAVVDGSGLFAEVDPNLAPISTALGVLGHTGLTAYFGLLDLGQPKAGETVVVSTAAGAVGSVVGQIAKIQGCRAVGFTGGEAKAALCRDEFNYDAAIDYRTADLDAALAEACPDGVDVYFDNVGGAMLDAVLRRLNVGARIVVCGTAATASWEPPPTGPRVERHILVNRARMQGILIFDYADRFAEGRARLAEWLGQGRIRHREEVLDGLVNAPKALEGLYAGRNMGKMLIRVRPEDA